MRKITSFIIMMIFLSSTALVGQSASNAISIEEEQMMTQRRANPNAQSMTIPLTKLKAKGLTYVAPNKGNRAVSNIKLEVQVDSYASEASYNVWDYD
ncbi:MAG: hypothetical protein HN993_07585, partial [Lentimicrobiaceae bacterium]|nr:hypothetical protein [Lentimicrobiaceae bacterium]